MNVTQHADAAAHAAATVSPDPRHLAAAANPLMSDSYVESDIRVLPYVVDRESFARMSDTQKAHLTNVLEWLCLIADPEGLDRDWPEGVDVRITRRRAS